MGEASPCQVGSSPVPRKLTSTLCIFCTLWFYLFSPLTSTFSPSHSLHLPPPSHHTLHFLLPLTLFTYLHLHLPPPSHHTLHFLLPLTLFTYLHLHLPLPSLTSTFTYLHLHLPPLSPTPLNSTLLLPLLVAKVKPHKVRKGLSNHFLAAWINVSLSTATCKQSKFGVRTQKSRTQTTKQR